VSRTVNTMRPPVNKRTSRWLDGTATTVTLIALGIAWWKRAAPMP
jgi:hypothetical protein